MNKWIDEWSIERKAKKRKAEKRKEKKRSVLVIATWSEHPEEHIEESECTDDEYEAHPVGGRESVERARRCWWRRRVCCVSMLAGAGAVLGARSRLLTRLRRLRCRRWLLTLRFRFRLCWCLRLPSITASRSLTSWRDLLLRLRLFFGFCFLLYFHIFQTHS